MSDLIAANRYARALFELAEKEGRLSEIHAGLEQVTALTRDHPQIMSLISNPTLSDEEKTQLIQNILPKDLPDLLIRFLKTLIEKKRFPLLAVILSVFHKAFKKKMGIQEVEIVSVVPFSSQFQERVKNVLKNKLRSEIQLMPKTDPSLLGGFVLKFDGREIDCSFQNRIHEIQQKLLVPLEEGIA